MSHIIRVIFLNFQKKLRYKIFTRNCLKKREKGGFAIVYSNRSTT